MSDAPTRLRRFEPGDRLAVQRWFANRRATRMLLEQRPSFSAREAEEWTRGAAKGGGEDRKYAIIVAGHKQPVGFTALYGLFRQTAPELGILIGDRVGGKVGRAAEALTLGLAFRDFGAHRVYGRIASRNRAAKWAVESLGWRREAILRQHLRRPGEPIEDCEIWGVLPDEFFDAAGGLLDELGFEPPRCRD